MRTYIKSVYAAIESNDKEAAASAYHSAVSIIDRNAKRGLHHKNKSARLKSRMNKRIMAMAWWSNTSNKKKYKKADLVVGFFIALNLSFFQLHKANYANTSLKATPFVVE